MATAAREDVAGDCTAFAGVVDVDNGNHRICSACVAKAGKRKVPAADSAGRAQSKRPKATISARRVRQADMTFVATE